MRVALLGVVGGENDEGMKNYGTQLQRHLKPFVDEIELFDLTDASKLFRHVRQFMPDIIHAIPGPGIKSIMLVRLLGTLTGAKTVLTALQPHRNRWTDLGFKLFPPDLLFCQSDDSMERFSSCGMATELLPSGVDTGRFTAADTTTQRKLRMRYGYPTDEPIFLHVGHVKRGRNVSVLADFAEIGTVIVIGSESTRPDRDIQNSLQVSGCNVLVRYIENIEDYYRMSNFYVFPTFDRKQSIEFPLSVLEAMACNLRVITTPFPGIQTHIAETNGVVFTDSFNEPAKLVNRVTDEPVRTRNQALNFDWSTVANEIYEDYKRL